MTPEEEEQIRRWNGELSADIHIGLFITEDPRSKEFEGFCENLIRLAPRIQVAREKGGPDEAPAIRIGDTLRYHAIPLGKELRPFLDEIGRAHV